MSYPAEHRRLTKQKIVRSARRLFNRLGFETVSIDDVMADAGLARGSFYSCFESKGDLYAEAVTQEGGCSRGGGTNMNLHRVSLVDSPASTQPPTGVGHPPGQPGDRVKLKAPSLLPGSDGEHALQAKYASEDRANTFYARQVLNFLAPRMREFISRQEFMFVSTADRHGECDCSPRFGEPGFIRVLGNKHLLYPEYRGNGVFASLGNISENPHIALLILDFYRDSIGLHVNGKARIVQSDVLETFADKLPKDVLAELAKDGKRRPNRWVMVEVEEAYIQCSKHIPLLKKLERPIDWGTDSAAAKKGDYFQLKDIPLYDRIGGDQAMDIAADLFHRKLLDDDLVGRFFDDVDMAAQRLKQKSFLAMAFGGPYQYSGVELVSKMGLEARHFDRISAILKETLEELKIGAAEIEEVMQVIETTREVILNLLDRQCWR